MIQNTYAMQDDKRDYCLLSGERRLFEWPDGAVRPKLNGCRDVFGCGLVLIADHKLAIFFTTNGILLGQFSVVINNWGIAKNGKGNLLYWALY
jgi:hypothetical protein